MAAARLPKRHATGFPSFTARSMTPGLRPPNFAFIATSAAVPDAPAFAPSRFQTSRSIAATVPIRRMLSALR